MLHIRDSLGRLVRGISILLLVGGIVILFDPSLLLVGTGICVLVVLNIIVSIVWLVVSIIIHNGYDGV